MNKIVSLAKSFGTEEDGAAMVEYVVLMGLILAVTAGILVTIGGQITTIFGMVSTYLGTVIASG